MYEYNVLAMTSPKCKSGGLGSVSYTHLDVYKRQGISGGKRLVTGTVSSVINFSFDGIESRSDF